VTPNRRRGIAILVAAAALTGCADDAATSESSADVSDTTATTTSTAPDVATLDDATLDDATVDDATTSTVTDTTETDTTVTSGSAGPSVDGLTTDEVAGVVWMREEEQLAHDLYTRFDELWNLRVFENISASEQRHIDITIGLLDDFGLDDPQAGLAPGTYAEPQIQALYDDLAAQGSSTALAALRAGALVEELDIADLRARAAATDDPTLADAYARLEQGSRNHLRAFVSQIEARGETYIAQVLDDADAIIAAPMERGNH
jgi:hypothetical protein